jgi:hypothetical protein
MPRSEWDDYADDRGREGDNGGCDEYSTVTGDCHDYAGAEEQALQDITLGREARIPLTPETRTATDERPTQRHERNRTAACACIRFKHDDAPVRSPGHRRP